MSRSRGSERERPELGNRTVIDRFYWLCLWTRLPSAVLVHRSGNWPGIRSILHTQIDSPSIFSGAFVYEFTMVVYAYLLRICQCRVHSHEISNYCYHAIYTISKVSKHSGIYTLELILLINLRLHSSVNAATKKSNQSGNDESLLTSCKLIKCYRHHFGK